MKQKLLFLLVAFAFSVCTMVAQNSSDDDIIVLDSTYLTDAASLQRTYFEYNEKGQETKETTITEMIGQNDMVSMIKLTYDELYRLINSEGYDIVDGNEVITSVQAYSDFDERRHAGTIEMIEYENGVETVRYKMSDIKYSTLGDCFLTYNIYVWQNGEWVFESEATGTENEKGLRETTTESAGGGISIITKYTYYENNLIKTMTTEYQYNGISIQSNTVYYYYEFGDYGEMPIFMTIKNAAGDVISETQYWYSPLKTAGIHDIIAKSKQPTMIFDLSGKMMGSSIEGLSDGIYIVKDAFGARKIKK